MDTEIADEGTVSVRALIIFSLSEICKRLLRERGCTFGTQEYGETILFPEGTTRILLYSRTGLPTNRYRLVLPGGVELREEVDDERTGKSRFLFLLDPGAMEQEEEQGYDKEARNDGGRST